MTMKNGVLLALALVACSSTESTPLVKPDDVTASTGSTAGSGGASSSSGTTTSGSGGASSGSGGASSGSGGNSSTPAGWESGTRLKARYYAGADGSVNYAGFRDSMLSVDCSPLLAEDGKTRCLPVVVTGFFGGFYEDSNCMQPVAYVSQLGCAPSPYVNKLDASTCPPRYQSYKLGAAYAGQLYSGSPGSCTTIASPNYDFYSATLEPATAFVEMTEMVEP
jgi:hypothetical protein